jgi:hypothetical protein
MNAEHDPLESELAALRPREPSPELHQRIAERLDDGIAAAGRANQSSWTKGTGNRAGVLLGLTVGAIAAAVAVAILVPRDDDRPPFGEPTVQPPQPLVFSVFDQTLPTVWQYHGKLGRSPRELEALLDQHAGRGRSIDAPVTPVHAFTRFDPGEL